MRDTVTVQEINDLTRESISPLLFSEMRLIMHFLGVVFPFPDVNLSDYLLKNLMDCERKINDHSFGMLMIRITKCTFTLKRARKKQEKIKRK